VQTFVMLTSLSPGNTPSPRSLEDVETEVMERIRKECEGVEWEKSFAVLGPYDYVDIFRAPDIESAAKVATIVRTVGQAHAEVWAATEWHRFKELIRGMDQEAA
jgi:uncharacterized protein with GYD domain